MSTPTVVPVLLEEAHDLPLVELYLVAGSGASHDTVGREGALNLALRSLRRGTATHDHTAIDAQIDRLGAEFGTSVDATSAMVHATVIRRNLDAFVDMVEDLVLRPSFPPEGVAQVAREIRADIIDSRDDDRTLAGRHFRRTLFAGHPYGRPTVGTPATLDHLTRADAVAARDHTFVRGNLLVAGSGDITHDQLNAIAQRLISGFADTPAPVTDLPEPKAPRGRNLVIVDKPARSQTQVYIGGLGTRARDRDHFPLMVANTIFGGTFTARLMREIRSKRGWSYGASSRLARDRAREAWSMWTFPAAADAARCIALQIHLLERFIADGVTARELSFARSYLTRSHAFEIDTAARRLWQQIDTRISKLPAGYPPDFVHRIEAVTLDEVNAAVRRRLSADNLVFTVVATASQLRSALETAIPDLASVRVIPFDAD